MWTELSSEADDERTVGSLATALALLVTVVSLVGLFGASDGDRVARIVGAVVGGGLFGGLTYWVVGGLLGGYR